MGEQAAARSLFKEDRRAWPGKDMYLENCIQ